MLLVSNGYRLRNTHENMHLPLHMQKSTSGFSEKPVWDETHYMCRGQSHPEASPPPSPKICLVAEEEERLIWQTPEWMRPLASEPAETKLSLLVCMQQALLRI